MIVAVVTWWIPDWACKGLDDGSRCTGFESLVAAQKWAAAFNADGGNQHEGCRANVHPITG